jgi:hypothetical protein
MKDTKEMISNAINARETLVIVADWLGWQNEYLSDGLKSPYDAVKLWEYAQANPDLGEMADEWPSKALRSALGYDPLKRTYTALNYGRMPAMVSA